MAVDITPQRIRIATRVADRVILEGELHMTCKPSETVWAVESEVLTLSIEKVVHTWWECVVAGHAMIDTQMVDSTQQVHDYDEETQGAIRKIMVRRLSLPARLGATRVPNAIPRNAHAHNLGSSTRRNRQKVCPRATS